MSPRFAAALLLLVCACSKGQSGPDGPSGGRMCTEIGCMNGLRIELAKASAWEPGAYTFAFVLDGEKVTCTGALPLKACDAGPSLTCDVQDKVAIGESGCALPPEQQGFGEIYLPAAVAQVEVSIARDGKQLGAAVLTPKYVESRPNGPDCPPVCNSAVEKIALP